MIEPRATYPPPMTGLMRTRDLQAMGYTRVAIASMTREGQILRIARGLYAPANYAPAQDAGLAQVASRSPKVVFCLLTALRLHGLTTQNPHEVWIAIDHKARAPKIHYPPLHVIRSTQNLLHEGIESMTIEGDMNITVTDLGKTIADCFKFRHKIGLDVAMEALREAWNAKRITMDELHRYAKVCRVENVMRPYLESLT